MAPRPVLFVDIDGVVADPIPHWLDLYNRDHGTNHKKSDLTEWDTRVCINADLSPYFSDYDLVRPVPNALFCLNHLRSAYRIVFATAGNGSIWLDKFYNRPEVIEIQDKSLLRGFALIDDNPMNLDGFVGERFLIAQPWNEGRGLNESHWVEITKHLMHLAIPRAII